jgi:beta-phosphoglucomutase-like phosphatase (HAD superfamily)
MEDTQRGKPDPQVFLVAAEKLGVPPGRCVVLEDSSNGALSGKRAGAYVVAVPSPYTREQDFSFADFVASDLGEATRKVEVIASQPGSG